MTWDDNQHAKFLERLRGSSPAVFAVAQHLHRKGCLVEIPPIRYAPTASEVAQFVDDGDLIVVTRQRVEVKNIKSNFTCKDDWPHPHLFISNVGAVDRANGAVAYYVIVNQNRTYAAIVRSSKTRTKWYVINCWCKNSEQFENNYCCPLELVEFVELPP